MRVEAKLLQENQVMLHTLAHLLLKKGIITQDEYGTAHDWFKDAFKRLQLASAEMSYKDPPPKEPSAMVMAVIIEIQTKLFEGPCPSSRTTPAGNAPTPSNSSTSPPMK